jgi:hypothetical protein
VNLKTVVKVSLTVEEYAIVIAAMNATGRSIGDARITKVAAKVEKQVIAARMRRRITTCKEG